MWALESRCPGPDPSSILPLTGLPHTGCGTWGKLLHCWGPGFLICRMETRRVLPHRVAVRIKCNLACGPPCDQSLTHVSTELPSDPEHGSWARLEKFSNTQVGFSL